MKFNVALVGDPPAAPPFRAENPDYSDGIFGVSVQTRAGKSYRLEYKDNLDDANWTELDPQPGDGTVMRLTTPSAAPQRFFRVREE
jgi:hypothetical protein